MLEVSFEEWKEEDVQLSNRIIAETNFETG